MKNLKLKSLVDIFEDKKEVHRVNILISAFLYELSLIMRNINPKWIDIFKGFSVSLDILDGVDSDQEPAWINICPVRWTNNLCIKLKVMYLPLSDTLVICGASILSPDEHSLEVLELICRGSLVASSGFDIVPTHTKGESAKKFITEKEKVLAKMLDNCKK